MKETLYSAIARAPVVLLEKSVKGLNPETVKKPGIQLLIMVLIFFSFCSMNETAHSDEIQRAVMARDLKKIEELVRNDKSVVNSRDSRGFTPLYIAITENSVDVVKLLIEKGADVNARTYGEPLLETTLDPARTELAELLILSGADINSRGARGTPLHRASMFGMNEIVALL